MGGAGLSNVQTNLHPNTGVANTGVASAPSNQGIAYHTSPNKDVGSPRKYLVMGPGGAYYKQLTPEM